MFGALNEDESAKMIGLFNDKLAITLLIDVKDYITITNEAFSSGIAVNKLQQINASFSKEYGKALQENDPNLKFTQLDEIAPDMSPTAPPDNLLKQSDALRVCTAEALTAANI